MRDADVILGGQTWRIKFVNRKELPSSKHMGICDWNQKTILIYKRLPLELLLDTLIHECRHAQHRVMFEAEEFIDSTSTEIAKSILQTRIITDD